MIDFVFLPMLAGQTARRLSSDAIPRMLRWTSTCSILIRQLIKEVFESLQVHLHNCVYYTYVVMNVMSGISIELKCDNLSRFNLQIRFRLWKFIRLGVAILLRSNFGWNIKSK